jgi:hypothetical protein
MHIPANNKTLSRIFKPYPFNRAYTTGFATFFEKDLIKIKPCILKFLVQPDRINKVAQMGYQRITMEEREEIFCLRYEERLFLREIGQKLHKDKSAISRELRRCTKNKL